MNFNKSIIPTPEIHGKELEKSELLLGHFPKISVVFSTILSFGVTLVTAKKQHFCWNVCACTRSRRMSVRYEQAVN